MNSASKSIPFFIFIASIQFASGMQDGLTQRAVPVTFTQAIMKADMNHGRDWLKQYVQAAQDLNEQCPQDGTYPIQTIVSGRYDSAFVAIALCNGARADLADKDGNTLLHTIVRCPSMGLKKEYAYFPEQNLLSVLALPTYQYPENIEATNVGDVVVELQPVKTAAQQEIKTFLLCLQKNELKRLNCKDIRFCIIAHLIDATCSLNTFRKTLAQMRPEKVIEMFPHAWVVQIAAERQGDDKTSFVKLYAPLLARYRLERAQKIVAVKNNGDKDVYELACGAVEFLRNQKFEAPFVRAAQRMVDALEPLGFVERHMPACTRIITNKLLGLDPFASFPEFNKEEEG